MTEPKKYYLKNLGCAVCAAKMEEELNKTPGVDSASVNFATCTLSLNADDLKVVEQTIQAIEPDVELHALEDPALAEGVTLRRGKLFSITISAVLWLVGTLFHDRLHATPYAIAEYLVLGIAFVLAGKDAIWQALRNLREGKLFDETFLMSFASIGAFAIHEIPEAVGVMLFYEIGEYLQDLTVERSRKSIQSLLKMRPDKANLKAEGEIRVVAPETVAVGERIIVRAGERVPLDGIIREGQSFVDTAALTGESTPRAVQSGSEVLAGMINQSGLLEIEVSRPFAESTVVRMLELVENASSRKAKTERFITRVAHYYTPAVVLTAFLIAVLPPLLIPGAQFSTWLYRALVLLVISCPCALLISVPLSYFGGLGAASKRGIFIKGANYLDVLTKVRTVVFDKTGTLTEGVFHLQKIAAHNGFSEEELLQTAAAAETHSTHPIAQSIRKVAPRVETLNRLEEYEEISGQGIRALLNGETLLVGSRAILNDHGVRFDGVDDEQLGTVVHIARGGRYMGYLLIGDQLKVDAAQAIDQLRRNEVRSTVMLSGDRADTAKAIAESIGLDRWHGELLPEDKLTLLEAIIAENDGHTAFVGDGINDAPVIARADVGIAMGGMGSDAAIETADVVLMTDSPAKVAEAIEISRYTRRILWQNIILVILIKLLFISLGAVGLASMWMAVIADVGVALLATLNATRIMRMRPRKMSSSPLPSTAR
ncbi:MAG: cadmium-translocating P-type ATPase [Anaerolineaceae bacterium]|nr:cadmium-translocating P-type ATPase [Anaerolineaceae bacterium]